MVVIILEPSDEDVYFVRTEINDNLMVNAGPSPTAALFNLAGMVLDCEEIDIFEVGFQLIPQSELDKQP